jgi:hypothetical protein
VGRLAILTHLGVVLLSYTACRLVSNSVYSEGRLATRPMGGSSAILSRMLVGHLFCLFFGKVGWEGGGGIGILYLYE